MASGVNDIENQKICPLSLEMLLRFSFAAIFLGGFVEGPSSKETV